MPIGHPSFLIAHDKLLNPAQTNLPPMARVAIMSSSDGRHHQPKDKNNCTPTASPVHGHCHKIFLLAMVLLASPWKSSSLSTISFLSSHQRRNALEFPSRCQSTLSLLKTEPNPMHESSSSRQDTLFDNLDLALPNDIYIRNATPKDLKSASYILTKAFFSFNIFTTPFEWLNIYLSLQDNVLETNNQYYMLVAIQRHPSQLKEKESVIGICEVDDRKTVNLDPAPRPYICNLAIGTERRRQGIGKAFISICEHKAQHEWQKDFLYLRVRRKNNVALDMYYGLGYVLEDTEQPNDKISGEDIVLLKKTFTKKIMDS